MAAEQDRQAQEVKHGTVRENPDTKAVEVYVVIDGKGEWHNPAERADQISRQEHFSRRSQRVAQKEQELNAKTQELERQRAELGARVGLDQGPVPPGPFGEQPTEGIRPYGPRRSPYDQDYGEEAPGVDPRQLTALMQQNRQLLQRFDVLESQVRTQQEVAALTEKYPDFDTNAIRTALAKMSPAEQEQYNNPLGWENIYLAGRAGQQQPGEGQEGQVAPGELRAETPYAESNVGSTTQFTGVPSAEKVPERFDSRSKQDMEKLAKAMEAASPTLGPEENPRKAT